MSKSQSRPGRTCLIADGQFAKKFSAYVAGVSRKLDIIDENDEQKVGQAEQLCYQTGGLCTRQEDAARGDRRQAVSGRNT